MSCCTSTATTVLRESMQQGGQEHPIAGRAIVQGPCLVNIRHVTIGIISLIHEPSDAAPYTAIAMISLLCNSSEASKGLTCCCRSRVSSIFLCRVRLAESRLDKRLHRAASAVCSTRNLGCNFGLMHSVSPEDSMQPWNQTHLPMCCYASCSPRM